MGKRIGDINTVTNKLRRPAANLNYLHIRVQQEDEKELSLLFTAHEMKRAALRAINNPEDVPKVGRIRNFFD